MTRRSESASCGTSWTTTRTTFSSWTTTTRISSSWTTICAWTSRPPPPPRPRPTTIAIASCASRRSCGRPLAALWLRVSSRAPAGAARPTTRRDRRSANDNEWSTTTTNNQNKTKFKKLKTTHGVFLHLLRYQAIAFLRRKRRRVDRLFLRRLMRILEIMTMTMTIDRSIGRTSSLARTASRSSGAAVHDLSCFAT